MAKLKILKEGNKYSVKKVHDNCYQLVIVLEEFETEDEAIKAMFKELKKEKISINNH